MSPHKAVLCADVISSALGHPLQTPAWLYPDYYQRQITCGWSWNLRERWITCPVRSNFFHFWSSYSFFPPHSKFLYSYFMLYISVIPLWLQHSSFPFLWLYFFFFSFNFSLFSYEIKTNKEVILLRHKILFPDSN